MTRVFSCPRCSLDYKYFVIMSLHTGTECTCMSQSAGHQLSLSRCVQLPHMKRWDPMQWAVGLCRYYIVLWSDMARPPMQSAIEHHSELFAMVWCCMGKEMSAAEVVWQLSTTMSWTSSPCLQRLRGYMHSLCSYAVGREATDVCLLMSVTTFQGCSCYGDTKWRQRELWLLSLGCSCFLMPVETVDREDNRKKKYCCFSLTHKTRSTANLQLTATPHSYSGVRQG